MEIRRATPDEAHALTALAHAAKRYWGYPEAFIRLWKRDLTFTPEFIEKHPVYAAVHRGDLIGVVALSLNRTTCELEHLWVAPERIGTGLGRRLLTKAVRLAKSVGAQRLEIASDPNAEVFYLRMGAQRIGYVPSLPQGRKLPKLVIRLDKRPSRANLSRRS